MLPTKAATIPWSGATSSSWSLPSNWVGGIAPTPADVAVFNAPAYANQPVLDAPSAVAGIQVGASSGAVSIGGTAALTIDASGIDMTLAAANLTLSAGTVAALDAIGA